LPGTNTLAYYENPKITAIIGIMIQAPGVEGYGREGDIYRRKPKSCLGRVFNFKLSSLIDNTINPLNANDHF
jgi:hypothetical protein